MSELQLGFVHVFGPNITGNLCMIVLQGFTNVIDIAGGFAAWKEIGLPSEA